MEITNTQYAVSLLISLLFLAIGLGRSISTGSDRWGWFILFFITAGPPSVVAIYRNFMG